MKKLAVMGSTGSIGTSTLSVAELYPEKFQVATLSANRNVDEMEKQCVRHRPELVALFDPAAARELRRRQPGLSVLSGTEGVARAATHARVDMVVAGISGAAGLIPTYEAVAAGKDLALANKETLVMAGDLVTDLAKRNGVRIIPVDSEHSALHQCLRGAETKEIRRLWLTASGGPFFSQPDRDLRNVTVDEALDHPTWDMGPKISIDSATLMNKGLEVIEAHHLFGIDADRLRVVIHPQSVVHALVEFVDGNFLTQMGLTDMRSAILYALCQPERCATRLPEFDPYRLPSLEFHPPDSERFPCLRLAYEALQAGRSHPIVLNAANEVAVSCFLRGEIGLTAIPRLIEETLQRHASSRVGSLENVLEIDREARIDAEECIPAVA